MTTDETEKMPVGVVHDPGCNCWPHTDAASLNDLRAENERLKRALGTMGTNYYGGELALLKTEIGRLRVKIKDQAAAYKGHLETLRAEIERLREECRLAAELQVRTGKLADGYLADLADVAQQRDEAWAENERLKVEVATLEELAVRNAAEIDRLQAQVAAHHTPGFVCQS